MGHALLAQHFGVCLYPACWLLSSAWKVKNYIYFLYKGKKVRNFQTLQHKMQCQTAVSNHVQYNLNFKLKSSIFGFGLVYHGIVHAILGSDYWKKNLSGNIISTSKLIFSPKIMKRSKSKNNEQSETSLMLCRWCKVRSKGSLSVHLVHYKVIRQTWATKQGSTALLRKVC